MKTDGYESGDDRISVIIEYDLRDSTGRAFAAGAITKHVDVGSGFATGGYSRTSDRSGGYPELQHEVAAAVARAVIFRIAPLRVVAVEGNRVRLNYGSGLLPVGSIVTVEAGLSSLRFLVASGSTTNVVADLRGSGDASHIVPGAVATFIEPDDPAANTPAYERVELP